MGRSRSTGRHATRRAIIEVNTVPLNRTLADAAGAIETYTERVERRRAAERKRKRREFALLGTSVSVMSMLLQVSAVVLFE